MKTPSQKVDQIIANVQGGHDVYSKQEVLNVINDVLTQHQQIVIDLKSIPQFTIKQVQLAMDEMFGDWNMDGYISLSLNSRNEIEIDFDDNKFKREAIHNIQNHLNDEL